MHELSWGLTLSHTYLSFLLGEQGKCWAQNNFLIQVCKGKVEVCYMRKNSHLPIVNTHTHMHTHTHTHTTHHTHTTQTHHTTHTHTTHTPHRERDLCLIQWLVCLRGNTFQFGGGLACLSRSRFQFGGIILFAQGKAISLVYGLSKVSCFFSLKNNLFAVWGWLRFFKEDDSRRSSTTIPYTNVFTKNTLLLSVDLFLFHLIPFGQKTRLVTTVCFLLLNTESAVEICPYNQTLWDTQQGVLAMRHLH